MVPSEHCDNVALSFLEMSQLMSILLRVLCLAW